MSSRRFTHFLTATTLFSLCALNVSLMADDQASPAESGVSYYKDIRPIFQSHCQGCHQPKGGGTPGQIPPLVNSSWVKGDPKLAAAIVLNGLQGAIVVNGTTYNGAVLTYIRQSWGNGEELVTAEQVAEARTMIKDSGHQGTWNKDSLDAAGFATPE